MILAAATTVSCVSASTCSHEVARQTILVGDKLASFFEPSSLSTSFEGKLKTYQYIGYGLRAQREVAGYDTDLHKYDSSADLLGSFARNLSHQDSEQLGGKPLLKLKRKQLLPTNNDNNDLTQAIFSEQDELFKLENNLQQTECGRQLDWLISEARQLYNSPSSYLDSKELGLVNLLDSFGSPSNQLAMGNNMWLGAYDQCLEGSRIGALGFETRFCLAKLKPNVPACWPEQSEYIKLALCLPSSCNSISKFHHSDRLESLIRTTSLRHGSPFARFNLSDLYCLPDEQSPLRQFSLSAKIFITLLSAWLTLVGYYSVKYEIQQVDKSRKHTQAKGIAKSEPLVEMLALRLAWQSLFSTTIVKTTNKQQTIVDSGDNQAAAAAASRVTDLEVSMSNNVIVKQATQSSRIAQQVARRVDLSAIDGIKVIGMIWLISAHTLLFLIRSIANGRQFWQLLRDARFMTIMAGIFPVDSFFTITGILTVYLKFYKSQQPKQQFARPKYWLEAFYHRYVRFMPMYFLVFWYTRDLSEYIGSGPLWDYATANTSLRATCKRESFAVPLMFGANFKPLEEHCVKPAWYLANDFQFLLVTPALMLLMANHKLVAYLLIGLMVALSLLLQFLTVFSWAELDDFGALINFKPMFGAYILKNLWKLYVLPYNRIPPYLIGLITGHLMFCWLKRAPVSDASDNNNLTTPIGNVVHSKSSTNIANFEDSNQYCPSASTRSQESLSQQQQRHHESTSSIISSSSSGDLQSGPKESRQLSSSALPDHGFVTALVRYVNLDIWLPVMVLISIIYLPLLTLITKPYDGLQAKVGSSLLIALMRLVWSLAVARLIFVCCCRRRTNESSAADDNNNKHSVVYWVSDSFIRRFLSSAKWKPWSKIGLSALLIQWEIISYFAQIQTTVPNMTFTYLMEIILICIASTYLLALLVYLTIEYPISLLEQRYLRPIFFPRP